jgi:hypothetical protein
MVQRECKVRQRFQRHIAIARQDLRNVTLGAPQAIGELLPRYPLFIEKFRNQLSCFKKQRLLLDEPLVSDVLALLFLAHLIAPFSFCGF